MDSVPSFYSITAASSAPSNGATSIVTLGINPSIKMIDGDTLFFTFPTELTLATSTVLCSAEGYVKTVSCALVTGMPNRISAKVTFNGGSVSANTLFTFKVTNVKNAPSTEPSSQFKSIKATDASGNDIAIFTGSGPTITNPNPATAVGTLA